MRALSALPPVILVLVPLVLMPWPAGADPEFGSTVRRNIEVQTIDMEPRYEGTLMEGGNGRRTVAAVQRYLEGRVKPLLKASGASEVGQQGGATEAAPSGSPK
jgi:hypothetical protein